MARAPQQLDLASDKAAALALTPVSRETETRLDRYVALLLEWQAKTNLVAPSTLPNLWTRHIADSLQLLSIAPKAKTWIDLGSGDPGKTLNLTARDVLDMSGTMHHLFVTGDAADKVTAPGPLWTNVGTTVDHGISYAHYTTAGNLADLYVQTNIDTAGLTS